MDYHEDKYGISWGKEIVPTASGAPKEEGSKTTKHYSSFRRAGIVYHNHDAVYVLASDGPPYIAKILAMYEDDKKEKCMPIRWFCRSCELPTRVAGVNYKDEDSKEIFLSWGLGSKSVLNPASVIGKCSVVCTLPRDWKSPLLPREVVDAADHWFSYAFSTSKQQIVSLNEIIDKLGLKYVRDLGVRSRSTSQTTGRIRRGAMESDSKAAETNSPVVVSDKNGVDSKAAERNSPVVVSDKSGVSDEVGVDCETEIAARVIYSDQGAPSDVERLQKAPG